MSNTQRWIQPGWDYPGSKSKKHQSKDRASSVFRPSFTNGQKNTRYNLLQKIFRLRCQEMIMEGMS
jgi:hypothetical protein